MVSQTPLDGVARGTLARRDLVALFAFLNRKGEKLKPRDDPFAQAEGVLQQLASAARMQ
jgi:hypothetical protein